MAEWGWGIPDMDYTFGKVASGRVYVFGGRPSSGKTALLFNLLLNVRRAVLRDTIGDRPWRMLGIFTERSRWLTIASLAALERGLDEDAVLREAWDELPEGAEQQVNEEMASLDTCAPLLTLTDTTEPTLDELKTLVAETKPQIVFLDYLQMVVPQEYEKDATCWRRTMRWLRGLAGQGITPFVGCQLVRPGQEKDFDKYRPPYLSSFYGGSMIEASAEVAFGVFRSCRAMTKQDKQLVTDGLADLSQWIEDGVMVLKCLKHSYRGKAADKIVRLRIAENRQLSPYDHVPF